MRKKEKELRALVEDASVQTWSSIMAAYRSIFATLDSALYHEQSSIPRFQIMFHLYFNGSHQPIELAKKAEVSRANMSSFIRRLLESETIEPCSGSQSEKRPAYKLTGTGIKEFEEYFPGHVHTVQNLVKPLNKKEIAKIYQIAKEASHANVRQT